MKVLARLLPVALVATLTSATGCIIADLSKVRETDRKAAKYAYLEGSVATQSPSAHWMVVFIARVPCDEDWHALREAVASGAGSTTGASAAKKRAPRSARSSSSRQFAPGASR